MQQEGQCLLLDFIASRNGSWRNSYDLGFTCSQVFCYSNKVELKQWCISCHPLMATPSHTYLFLSSPSGSSLPFLPYAATVWYFVCLFAACPFLLVDGFHQGRKLGLFWSWLQHFLAFIYAWYLNCPLRSRDCFPQVAHCPENLRDQYFNISPTCYLLVNFQLSICHRPGIQEVFAKCVNL